MRKIKFEGGSVDVRVEDASSASGLGNEAAFTLEEAAKVIRCLNVGDSESFKHLADLFEEGSCIETPFHAAVEIDRRIRGEDWRGMPYPCLPVAYRTHLELGWGRTSVEVRWPMGWNPDMGAPMPPLPAERWDTVISIRITGIPEEEGRAHPRVVALEQYLIWG